MVLRQRNNKKLEKILNIISKGTAPVKDFQEHLESEGNKFIMKLDTPDELKKDLWNYYFKQNEQELDNLVTLYNSGVKRLDEILDDASKYKSEWHETVRIFEDRFYIDFKIDIDNKKDVVVGRQTARLHFIYNHNDEKKKVIHTKESLLGLNILSGGEKRVLYLLYVIFEVQRRKKKGGEHILIIDDIADSFDYKNKYAIIEYLQEISKYTGFYLIILTHNFDFFRTTNDRLNLPRENRLHVVCDSSKLKIYQEDYQGNPFDTWKHVMKARPRYGISYSSIDSKKHILALIPFVRNLIDFGYERNVNTYGLNDNKLLTSLLHIKIDTRNITIIHLKEIFLGYIGKNDFDSSISDSDSVFDLFFDIVENHISDYDLKLENKIILAIAIRLKAEEYMISKISDPSFCSTINSKQTRALYDKIINEGLCPKKEIEILDSVNIMTPENIHINSFMYEPILDMDIIELKSLYEKVKKELI